MGKRKITFKCDCGHMENDHNWDPYSSFFGCCSFVNVTQNLDGSLEPEQCPCNRFKIDNLRFLEELYAQRHTHASNIYGRNSRH